MSQTKSRCLREVLSVINYQGALLIFELQFYGVFRTEMSQSFGFFKFFFLIIQLLPNLFTWLMSRAYFLGSCHHLLCFTDRVVKDCMLVMLL